MRKLVLQEFVSLDGLATGPNNSVDFIPASTQGDLTFGREQLDLMSRIDTMLLGRVTYQMFSGFWPNVTEGAEKDFADKFNAVPKVVFSTTLERAPWGSWDPGRIVGSDPVAEVTKLKREPGKDILLSGSLTIAQLLIDAKLVDEYRLVLCPVVLGGGRSLFREKSPSIPLTVVNASKLDRGAVSLVYFPRK